MKPNLELLRDAYMIIDGIPDELINLDRVYTTENIKPACGTIACAAGWLALHPTFQSLGFKFHPTAYQNITMQGVNYFDDFNYKIKKLFDIGVRDSQKMFGARGQSSFDRSILRDSPNKLSDKELWKKRVVKFIQQQNELEAS